ncbi:MAG TPA: mechanosensitive ion channel [Bacillota bacterium]|nr:mechanosensitive ion channel [Bacillota bacterium]HOK69552.1 mechanosensitive ion channel [Bacillota bacterium]HPP85939.1 mechanosensitive ion channel [Bacillota bacterium]
MFAFLYSLIEKIYSGSLTNLITYVFSFLVILISCALIFWILRYISVRIMKRITNRFGRNWLHILYNNRFFHRLAWIAVPFMLNLFASIDSLPGYNTLLVKFSHVFSVIVFLLLASSAISSADDIYRGYEISKIRPIKGILQVVQTFIYIVGGVTVIAIFIGQNPVVLLGGIGALTAVITLVFKDAILGFVAGIQLTANDMIRIGDWIEMPKYAADGTVIDLSLTTVKVQNFDKSVTSVPAYALISDSFINWRGMEKAGARRIKRALYIDVSGIRLCDDQMIEKFSKIELIQSYIQNKTREIDEYNQKNNTDLSVPVNGRHLTNLGVFRIYIVEYLKQRNGIHKQMPIIVRQLESKGEGIPLEIYAYTDTTKWAEYEVIQADIFDHLYSVISEFGLSLYQLPSGNDLMKAFRKGQ